MGEQSVFGAGYLWGTLAGSNQTPRLFAALQDVTVDFSSDLKPLWGSRRYALEQGSGKAKIEAKAAIGRFDPKVFNDLYFGGTITSGYTATGAFEAGTIPAPSGPYAVTVTNSATWATDLGVWDVTGGKYMSRVSSGPTTGQYSVSAGVYTFAAADASHSVQISYTYTVSGSGWSVATGNPIIGATRQIFRADLFNSYNSKTAGITLYACQSSKLGMPFKQDDWMMTSFDFSAQDDGSGNVCGVYGLGAF